jgi:cytoskeletal protein CcmA (bactofilin family)
VILSAILAGAPARAQDGELQEQLEQMQRQLDAQQREIEALRAERPPATADDPRVGVGEVVRIGPGEQVDEVVSFGHDVDVQGYVEGDAVSVGGDVRVGQTGVVEGDAVSFGGRIQVDRGGRVEGNRVALSMPVGLPEVELEPDDSPAAGNLHVATDVSGFLRSLYHRTVWMLSVAGASVLVVGLFPQRVNRVAQDLEARPVRSAVVGTLATGFLAMFAALFVVVTLGLGAPVSLLLVALLGMAWLLGFVGLCQAVGDRLPVQERPHGRWIALLVGVLLMTFLGSLPWVGWVVVGGASLLGIGAALSTRFGGAT